MARELFGTDWIKLEVIGHHDSLQPDIFALVEAARILSEDGFKVFPYTTEDIVVGEETSGSRLPRSDALVRADRVGARDRSIRTPLKSYRAHFPDVPLVVDAGLGRPSHALQVMELGFDAVLLNTAVARAGDPVAMAAAFRRGGQGRAAGQSGPAARAARHGKTLNSCYRHGGI